MSIPVRLLTFSFLCSLPLSLACLNSKSDDDDDDGDDTGGGGWDLGDGGGNADGGVPDGGAPDGGGADGGGDGGGGDGGGDGGFDGGGDGGFDGGGGDGGGGDGGGGDGGFDGGGGDGGGDGGVDPDDRDGDGYEADDCNDDNADIHPGADEVCDRVDNDCDDDIDEDPVDGELLAPDRDDDGLGEFGGLVNQCEGVDNDWDCDDGDGTEPQVVDVDGGSSRPDGSLDDPWPNIQDGIENAASCVIVMAGTYEEALDFGGRNIEVWGVEGSTSTIVDAAGTGQPTVTFASSERPDAILRGFTLTGGEGNLEETSETTSCGSSETCTDYYSTYCGGALFVSGADPTLSDLLLAGNRLPEASSTSKGNDDYFVYSYGGGACFMDSAASLNRVDFFRNFADQGGAAYIDETSIVDMNRAWVNSNASSYGGGIQVDGGSLTLANIASVWNSASTEGGGVLVLDGTLNSLNVTHGGDEAPLGGAISLSGSSEGGLMNSIVYGSANGEGVLVGLSADFTGTYNNVYGNVDGNYEGVTDPTGSLGNISVNPRFVAVSDDDNPANDDWSLLAASPSVDAGNSSAVYDDPDGSRNDQGAFGGPGGDWN